MSAKKQTLFRQVYLSILSTLSKCDTYNLRRNVITINRNYWNPLRNTSNDIKYNEIEDILTANQSWLGYFCGYGKLDLLTSSGTYKLKFVKDHQALRDAINERR